ncbi:MAG: hypothetical protein V8S10_00570 [Clostridia bacterium]|jgi:hypothetical protein
MSIEQIINKAKKIRGENSLEVLKGEKEILERLDEIEENTNNENKEFNEKILIEIESYLKIKENIQIQIEDYKFLKTIAQELRKQEVRRTDISTPPLFVIKNSQGQEMFFITRKALNEYIECNKKSLLENKTIIEIPSNNSYELEKLIEIIKRNF